MTRTLKGRYAYAQDGARAVEPEARRSESISPAGGLMIAIGGSMILWAVIAQAGRWASHFFF